MKGRIYKPFSVWHSENSCGYTDTLGIWMANEAATSERHSFSPRLVTWQMRIQACLPTLGNKHYFPPDEAAQSGFYWRWVQFYTRTPRLAVNPLLCTTRWIQWIQNQPRKAWYFLVPFPFLYLYDQGSRTGITGGIVILMYCQTT
jgi:hypothetical protein